MNEKLLNHIAKLDFLSSCPLLFDSGRFKPWFNPWVVVSRPLHWTSAPGCHADGRSAAAGAAAFSLAIGPAGRPTNGFPPPESARAESFPTWIWLGAFNLFLVREAAKVRRARNTATLELRAIKPGLSVLEGLLRAMNGLARKPSPLQATHAISALLNERRFLHAGGILRCSVIELSCDIAGKRILLVMAI